MTNCVGHLMVTKCCPAQPKFPCFFRYEDEKKRRIIAKPFTFEGNDFKDLEERYQKFCA